MYSGVLEAAGPAAEQWLLSPAFEERLFSYFPCADPPAAAGSPVVRRSLQHPNAKSPNSLTGMRGCWTRPLSPAALWCGAASSWQPCGAGLWVCWSLPQVACVGGGCEMKAPTLSKGTKPCIKPYGTTTGQWGGGGAAAALDARMAAWRPVKMPSPVLRY